jgi:hypothetical protein
MREGKGKRKERRNGQAFIPGGHVGHGSMSIRVAGKRRRSFLEKMMMMYSYL